MRWSLNEITWDTLAAVATFAAVLVALIPIWREAHRRKAHARGLRIRLCSKLTVLRPSLRRVAQCGQASFPNALLTKEEFSEAVRAIGAMMQESFVLRPQEQDRLGQAFANLELAVLLYDTTDFRAKSAEDVLKLIDRAVSAMEGYGLMHAEVDNPWDDPANEQG